MDAFMCGLKASRLRFADVVRLFATKGISLASTSPFLFTGCREPHAT